MPPPPQLHLWSCSTGDYLRHRLHYINLAVDKTSISWEACLRSGSGIKFCFGLLSPKKIDVINGGSPIDEK